MLLGICPRCRRACKKRQVQKTMNAHLTLPYKPDALAEWTAAARRATALAGMRRPAA
jgi:hypothetical protein